MRLRQSVPGPHYPALRCWLRPICWLVGHRWLIGFWDCCCKRCGKRVQLEAEEAKS